jgi:hypothetical protein
VSQFVTENLVPVKVHIKENREQFRRFTAKWTPTIMIVDPTGKELFRTEGYLPPHDFLAQLMIGLGRALFLLNKPKDAHRFFREVADRFTDTDFAAEAEYWSAVSQYRATADHKFLDEVAGVMAKKYPTSNWTKRASVWAH